MYKKLSEFNYKHYFGNVMNLSNFLKSVKEELFTSGDILIHTVLVNNYKTDIFIKDWSNKSTDCQMSLLDLNKIHGNVELVWHCK